MQMTIECIRDVLNYIAEHQHFKNETINKDKNVKYKFVRLGEYTLIQDLIKTKGTKTYTEEDIAYTITCLIDGGYLLRLMMMPKSIGVHPIIAYFAYLTKETNSINPSLRPLYGNKLKKNLRITSIHH